MNSIWLAVVLVISLGISACSTTPKFGQENEAATAMQNCNDLLDKGKHKQATRCYEMFRVRFGGSALAEGAELKLADISFDKKEYLLAAETYRAFAKLHPSHSQLPYVYYKAGLSYLKESPKAIDRDQQYLDEAIGYFEIGVQYFRGSPFQEVTREALKEARRRLAARELYVGRYYYKQKEFRASLPRFAVVADNYRGLGFDEEALYLMSKAYVELDDKTKAFEVAAVLKSRHPNSKYLDRLLKDLGVD